MPELYIHSNNGNKRMKHVLAVLFLCVSSGVVSMAQKESTQLF